MMASGEEILMSLREAVVAGDKQTALESLNVAVQTGLDPKQIIDSGLGPAMHVVGEKFESREFFLGEMLVAANVMKEAMNVLRPLIIASGESKNKGTIVIATVKGDIHDIGKNIAGSMLEGAGFKIVDLGVSVPADQIVRAATENNADIVGLSAVFSTTMVVMKEVIDSLQEAGVKDSVRVIIGGAATTQRFAKEIGADAWASDAYDGVVKALRLVRKEVT